MKKEGHAIDVFGGCRGCSGVDRGKWLRNKAMSSLCHYILLTICAQGPETTALLFIFCNGAAYLL